MSESSRPNLRANSLKPTSLRRRVVCAFALFAFVLSTLFGLSVWGMLHLAEDQIVDRYLHLELEDYLEHVALNSQAPLPATRWLSASFEVSQLPPQLRHAAADLPNGIHEVTWFLNGKDEREPAELTLLSHTLEDGRRLYLWVDTAQIEILDESMVFMGLALLITIATITTVGIAIGRGTAQRVIAPVIELAARVRRRGSAGDRRGTLDTSEAAEAPLYQGLADDEVGLLARSLEAAYRRSDAYLQRERRFTRDASHELRSPVTVVRGAVELLESRPESRTPGVSRPLARIRRAADDMSDLIEAFLWLAREEASSDTFEARPLASEIESIVERHRHLLVGKPVDLQVMVGPQAKVEAPAGVLGIVLGNLLANAFFYTRTGHITIRADERRFEITDTGPGIPSSRLASVRTPFARGSNSQGFGLGLAISQDLCERFGWRLDLYSEQDGSDRSPQSGTRAVVRFLPSET